MRQMCEMREKKIVLDVFGSDAPERLIEGLADASDFLKENRLTVVLPGDPSLLETWLEQYGVAREVTEILPASQMITNDDSPAMAVLRKKDASLTRGVRYLKEQEPAIGMISAGNTGALLAGSVLILGRLPGVILPALATFLPTLGDHYPCMLDCGANVDCTPVQLTQFALMGSALVQSMYGLKEPTCALLSIGTEDKKGNALSKEAFARLKELPIRFVGNMEARDALSGAYDVIVCDGFAGNILLKTIEGTAHFMMDMMDRYLDIYSGAACHAQTFAATDSAEYSVENFMTPKAKALIDGKTYDNRFAHRAVQGLSIDMDLGARGGAFLLGTHKIVMKIHGSSQKHSVLCALRQILDVERGGFIERQQDLLEKALAEEMLEKAEQKEKQDASGER